MMITVSTDDGRAEPLPVEGSTVVQDLLSLVAPIFGLAAEASMLVFNGRPMIPTQTLQACGVSDGDLIMIVPMAAPQQAPPSAPMNLDFSSLLSGQGSQPTTGGALPNLIPQQLARTQSSIVEWAGMSLDDVFQNNTNPAYIVQIVRTHENVWKELNYHNSTLARQLKESSEEEAIRVMRDHLLTSSQSHFMGNYDQRRQEHVMEERLRRNPYDKEANEYFANKINQQNIDDQYRQMMTEYPEALARVLMLYISTEVNGRPVQAFVDSGAQSTIMSSQCAERLDILRLVDKRFEGTAVGVGSGKIMGRIHLVNLKIGGYFFPCSITVMDSDQGLGDKNMDFLFGLDMLKRHRCNIDLRRNALVLTVDDKDIVTPFLHEHELDVSKGGTRGFDPNQAEEFDDGSSKPQSAPQAQQQATPPPHTTETAAQTPQPTQAQPTGGGDLGFTLDFSNFQGGTSTSQQTPQPSGTPDFRQLFDALVAQGIDPTTATAMALQQMADSQRN